MSRFFCSTIAAWIQFMAYYNKKYNNNLLPHCQIPSTLCRNRKRLSVSTNAPSFLQQSIQWQHWGRENSSFWTLHMHLSLPLPLPLSLPLPSFVPHHQLTIHQLDKARFFTGVLCVIGPFNPEGDQVVVCCASWPYSRNYMQIMRCKPCPLQVNEWREKQERLFI